MALRAPDGAYNENAENQIAPYLRRINKIWTKYFWDSELWMCVWSTSLKLCKYFPNDEWRILPLTDKFDIFTNSLVSLLPWTGLFPENLSLTHRLGILLTPGVEWRLIEFWEIFHFVWKNTSVCVKDMKDISDLHNVGVLLILEQSEFILELMQDLEWDLPKKVLWRTL